MENVKAQIENLSNGIKRLFYYLKQFSKYLEQCLNFFLIKFIWFQLQI